MGTNIIGWQLAAFVFAFFDSFATYIHMALGNALEGNGIIAAAMESVGTEAALVYRTGIVGLFIVTLGVLALRYRTAEKGLRFVTFALGMVAVYHLAGPSIVGALTA